MAIDYVFELPHNNPTSGGVYHTIGLAIALRNLGRTIHIRFHRITHRTGSRPPDCIDTSVGLPDNAFPGCRFAITYSDSPHLHRLRRLSQVEQAGILMLSYGMSPERERENVQTDGVVVMASTYRTLAHMGMDHATGHYVGFGFDPSHWFIAADRPKQGERYAALLRHPGKGKRYGLAAEVATELCQQGLIDKYITFGPPFTGEAPREPHCAGHIANASHSELRGLFNACRVFIMPSVTEGLNRTPAEATLCGCPAVLCDGALGELYFPEVNCKWVFRKDSYEGFLGSTTDVLMHDYGSQWAADMRERVVEYTFEAMAKRVVQAMEEAS